MIIIILVTLSLISCSSSSNKKSLSEQQLEKYISRFPEYPKLETFNEQDQIKIASLPEAFKIWATDTLVAIKCLKNKNLCYN